MSMSERIRSRVEDALHPTHLELVDESSQHNVPKDNQSHFNLFVVSPVFEGKREVARHQMVYQALRAEMTGGIHALALKTLTPTEWADAGGGGATSPQCLGGSKPQSA